jgi:hypothetical protein
MLSFQDDGSSRAAQRVIRQTAQLATLLMLAMAISAAKFPTAASAYVYWVNGSSIARANLDGSQSDPEFIADAGSRNGIAVDSRHMYWQRISVKGKQPPFKISESIARARLSGTRVEPQFISRHVAVGGNAPGLAVNSKHIYWVNPHKFGIARANINGKKVDPNFITGLDYISDIAVDSRHIYWSGAYAIGRADLDGTDVRQEFIGTGLSVPVGVTVDRKNIYWTMSGYGIGRARLDGTNVEQDFLPLPVSLTGIAVDSAHIYWADFGGGGTGSVGRANLSGRGANDTFIGGQLPLTGLALDALGGADCRRAERKLRHATNRVLRARHDLRHADDKAPERRAKAKLEKARRDLKKAKKRKKEFCGP